LQVEACNFAGTFFVAELRGIRFFRSIGAIMVVLWVKVRLPHVFQWEKY